MNNPLSSVYLRFLELSRALSETSGDPLSANEKTLLDAVALAWHSGSPMSVRQAIALDHLGSPATLHKRLAVLRNSGYVEEIAVEGDRRTKLLGPTQKALDFFSKYGEAIRLQQI